MSDPVVEFLDGEGESDDAGPAAPVSHRVPVRTPVGFALLAVLAWLAAAALSLVAPWQRVYRIALPRPDASGPRPDLSVDGWGRVSALAADGGTSGHAGRLGIVLCVCAGLFLAAAALAAASEFVSPIRPGHGVLGRAVLVVAVATPALCAGVAGAAWLDVRAMADSQPTGNLSIEYTYGPFLWCCLGAILCGALAVAAHLLGERPPPGDGREEPGPDAPGG